MMAYTNPVHAHFINLFNIRVVKYVFTQQGEWHLKLLANWDEMFRHLPTKLSFQAVRWNV